MVIVKGVMNTPDYQNPDALALIRTFSDGREVNVLLDCGKPHRFVPRDLLHNQEAFLLLVAIEQVLVRLAGNVAMGVGNAELSAQLGVPPVIAPSLSVLLGQTSLPPTLHHGINELRVMRNVALHGAAPLLVRRNVSRVRRVYAELLTFSGCEPEGPLADAIRRVRTALCRPTPVNISSEHGFLSDLIDMADVERSLRAYLVECGLDVRHRDVVDCAHRLLDDPVVRSRRLPAGLLLNLRKVFILRNLMAHGVILGLTPAQRAIVRAAAQDMHAVISGANLAKSGGKMVLGDGFTNSALALGLAAMTLG